MRVLAGVERDSHSRRTLGPLCILSFRFAQKRSMHVQVAGGVASNVRSVRRPQNAEVVRQAEGVCKRLASAGEEVANVEHQDWRLLCDLAESLDRIYSAQPARAREPNLTRRLAQLRHQQALCCWNSDLGTEAIDHLQRESKLLEVLVRTPPLNEGFAPAGGWPMDVRALSTCKINEAEVTEDLGDGRQRAGRRACRLYEDGLALVQPKERANHAQTHARFKRLKFALGWEAPIEKKMSKTLNAEADAAVAAEATPGQKETAGSAEAATKASPSKKRRRRKQRLLCTIDPPKGFKSKRRGREAQEVAAGVHETKGLRPPRWEGREAGVEAVEAAQAAAEVANAEPVVEEAEPLEVEAGEEEDDEAVEDEVEVEVEANDEDDEGGEEDAPPPRATACSGPALTMEGLQERLAKLKELYDKGLLSQSVYDAKQHEFLASAALSGLL